MVQRHEYQHEGACVGKFVESNEATLGIEMLHVLEATAAAAIGSLRHQHNLRPLVRAALKPISEALAEAMQGHADLQEFRTCVDQIVATAGVPPKLGSCVLTKNYKKALIEDKVATLEAHELAAPSLGVVRPPEFPPRGSPLSAYHENAIAFLRNLLTEVFGLSGEAAKWKLEHFTSVGYRAVLHDMDLNTEFSFASENAAVLARLAADPLQEGAAEEDAL